MKKIFSVLLIFTVLLTMSGCMADKDSPREELEEPSDSPVTSVEDESSEKLTDSVAGIIEIIENPLVDTMTNDTSTFSIDVDTTSYSVFRKYLSNDQKPVVGAIRTEELVNYFDYNYPRPVTDVPFSIITEIADTPWNSETKLLMIGLQGKEIEYEEAPANNLVLLIDKSGSMSRDKKLVMVKASLALLIENLREIDTISIVAYAGAAEVVLTPTSGTEKTTILDALNSIEANGSTNGQGGIEYAYDFVYENFDFGGNNRVILCTDGDFNVGKTKGDTLSQIVQEKAEIGIYLTILSYGSSIWAQSEMETLSNEGQGTYHYIDTLEEADKVLNREVSSALVPIADDVKIQVEFNSDIVESYRLIGYENRVLSNEAFDDDEVDAGELGAGHNVTAFYEITLKSDVTSETIGNIATVRLRYKDVGESISNEVEGIVRLSSITDNPSSNFKFASAVVEVSLLLRDSNYLGDANFTTCLERIENNIGFDEYGLRQEFYDLVTKLDEIMN